MPLEYLASESLFIGKMIKKEVHKDSLNYSLTFKVLKVYKGKNLSEEMTFTKIYQKESEQDSCYNEFSGEIQD